MVEVIMPFPDVLGLSWGLSRQECSARLASVTLKQTDSYIIASMPTNSKSINVELLFKNEIGLWKIQVVLYKSRSFWEDYTTDDLEYTMAESKRAYEETIQLYISELGPPDFTGDWGDENYPIDQNAWSICCWNQPQERLQIEYEQPDKEFPFFVRVVTYHVNSSPNS